MLGVVILGVWKLAYEWEEKALAGGELLRPCCVCSELVR